MPCRSDYMDPTQKERLLQETAQLTVYVLESKGEFVPPRLQAAAKDVYCREDYVALLCVLVREFTPEEMNKVVFDGRSKNARKLADWWEKHEEADRIREAKEAQEKRDAEIKTDLLNKLTEEEIDFLTRNRI